MSKKLSKLIELLSDKALLNQLLDDDDNTEIIESLITKLVEHNEGAAVLNCISLNQVMNEWDARGEIGSIYTESYNILNERNFFKNQTVKNYPCNENIIYFRKILNLPSWYSKEDIINEITNIL